MTNDTISLKGELHIQVRNTQTGVVIERTEKNLVVAIGKAFIASRMASATDPVMSDMAVGTGTTAPAGPDTALETELVRVTLSVSGGTPSTNTVLYTASFPAGVGTGAITEAGLFGSTMLSRTTFPVINKGASDEMIGRTIDPLGKPLDGNHFHCFGNLGNISGSVDTALDLTSVISHNLNCFQLEFWMEGVKSFNDLFESGGDFVIQLFFLGNLSQDFSLATSQIIQESSLP